MGVKKKRWETKKGWEKSKKSLKKIVRNLKKIIFFSEFFQENVLKTLLRGRETTRKNYWVVFEKNTFFDDADLEVPGP